jgi:predicted transcriptional regulator
VLDYLATRDTDEQVGEETKAAIEEGLADLRAGRTMTLEEYRRTRGL